MGADAIFTLVLAQTGRAIAQPGSRRGIYVLYLLPPLMCLDNLAASFELVQAGSPLLCAVVIGSVSGLVSVCGFKAGAVASDLLRRFRGGESSPGQAVTLTVWSFYWRPCCWRYKIAWSVKVPAAPER